LEVKIAMQRLHFLEYQPMCFTLPNGLDKIQGKFSTKNIKYEKAKIIVTEFKILAPLLIL
jgi:hypothetical protein